MYKDRKSPGKNGLEYPKTFTFAHYAVKVLCNRACYGQFPASYAYN